MSTLPPVPRLRSARAPLLLAAALALVSAPAGHAATYVIPHWIETSASTATTANAFDDFVYLRYTPGLAGSLSGPGATVDLYLYDNSAGSPLTIYGTQVCNPCTYSLGGASPRAVTAEIGQLIATKAGFAVPTYVGYAVLVVHGADPGGVTIENTLVNSHTGPFDLNVASIAPIRLRAEDPALPGARVFSIAHMLDTPGTTQNANAFDETLFATYIGGQAGVPAGVAGNGATVSLYLYDETTGTPLTNYNAPVCAPCTFAIGGAAPRKLTIRMEDLVLAKGAFDAAAKRATGVVVTGGLDPGAVTLQPWLVNSHTSGLDLGMTLQQAQPVWTGGLTAVVGDDRTGAVRSATVAPNPSGGAVRLAFEIATPAAVDAGVYDVAGRRVADLGHARLEPGAHELTWDGRDASGQRVEGGIYFVRVTGADRSVASRVIMLP